MATIQIKNVPDDVHHVLRRRAAAAGQSLQEYLLAHLRSEAASPTLDEVLDRTSHRSDGHVSFEDAVRILREERDAG